jgi:hypothetical protein
LTVLGFTGRASDALEHAILDLDALRLVDPGPPTARRPVLHPPGRALRRR